MYGKHITVNRITVFVFGLPTYTEEQWIEKAKAIIEARNV